MPHLQPLGRFSCFLLSALAVIAQTDRGTITGVVTDPAMAAVPNAAIEVKNADTGAVYPGASSATGNYSIQAPVGSYDLTVTAAGFKKYVRENLTVAIATAVRQDVALEIGAVTETVTVTGASSMLKMQGGEVSYSMNAGQLSDLPTQTLNGAGGTVGNIRNPLSVIMLVPGTQFATDNLLRINGMPSSTFTLHIEGQDATNGEWRELTQMTQPSTEAIQELAIQTSNYAAEYGQAGGGYFNLTMRSGGNQFHGGAYNFRIGPERRYNLQIRAEFQNVFNRLFLPAPPTPPLQVTPTPASTQTFNSFGVPTAGFGFVNVTGGLGSNPRRGQMVARFTF